MKSLLKRSLFPIVSILTLSGLASCSNQAKEQAPEESISPKEELRALLTSVSNEGKTMFGHHDDPVYGHSWCGDKGRSDVLEVVGDYPAVMSWDLGGIERGDTANLDGVPFSTIREEVKAQAARGGINTFSWHLWNPITEANSWEVSDTTVVDRMVNDSIGNAAFRKQLDYVADFFNSLTDDNGEKIGVIFRPWHEHTGGWFFWGATNCTVDDYKSLWKTTREVLDEKGVDNVLYAYSPDRVSSSEQYLERYPGDEYIDILGTDIYHFGGEEGTEGYNQTVSNVLGIVRNFAKEHGKIAAFTETGLESLPIDSWWTSVLLPLLKENPVAYVVVWRNAHDKPGHFYTPYPGQSSEESFKAFYNDSTTLFSKDIKNNYNK